MDEDGDGRFDTLVVETRGLKSNRVYDSSGAPFHKDGQTIVKERISLDRADANVLLDEITTIDHALKQPWTVTRKYRRDPKAVWVETACAEDNHQLRIGNEDYYIGADGDLLPTKKDQRAPDLKFFTGSQK
jgi:predicted N-formylglutamate amidohydrolase